MDLWIGYEHCTRAIPERHTRGDHSLGRVADVNIIAKHRAGHCERAEGPIVREPLEPEERDLSGQDGHDLIGLRPENVAFRKVDLDSLVAGSRHLAPPLLFGIVTPQTAEPDGGGPRRCS